MKKEHIVATKNTLGGSPRLDGRRLDVRHVIWGITDYDNGNIVTYQEDFKVTQEQIRHAVLYCKDEICEQQKVIQSCNGCSKKFHKDLERLRENGMINENESDEVNPWEVAQVLHMKLKEELNLPETYKQLFDE